MLHNVSQSIRFNILFQFKISEHHNFLSCQVSAWESVISHEIKNRTRPSPPCDLHTIPHWYTTANNLSSFYRACHYFWFWKIWAKSYNKQNEPEKVTLNNGIKWYIILINKQATHLINAKVASKELSFLDYASAGFSQNASKISKKRTPWTLRYNKYLKHSHDCTSVIIPKWLSK